MDSNKKDKHKARKQPPSPLQTTKIYFSKTFESEKSLEVPKQELLKGDTIKKTCIKITVLKIPEGIHIRLENWL